MTTTAELIHPNPTLTGLCQALDRIAETIGECEPLSVNMSTVSDRKLSVQLTYSDFVRLFACYLVKRETVGTHEHFVRELSGVYYTTCRSVKSKTEFVSCPEPESVGGES